MKKKRLLKLAALLRADAANKKGLQFNMSHWAAPTGRFNSVFYEEPKKLPEVSCGTSGCALGLAVLSGAFKRAGLTALYHDNNRNGIIMEPAIADPEYGTRTGFDAAMTLFGITPTQSWYLFGPTYYPKEYRTAAKGERYVAKRIERFVELGAIPARALRLNGGLVEYR